MEFHRCYSCMRELGPAESVCPYCRCDNAIVAQNQPAHALPCGTVLNGRYIVGKMLGQGGFGITYIGYDLTMDMAMCIKEYYPDGSAVRLSGTRQVYWGSSETAQGMKVGRESFLKEARRAFRLRDLEYVVHVSNMFYENETAYIVMDYIEGETLGKRILRIRKTMTEQECFALLEPIIAELDKVHARGIIHRDIKPDNIMLRTDGKPVLLDMGAAKDLSKKGNQSSTLVASQGFSPPEQYQTNGNFGSWTDVYAICAMIYYCVTGRVVPTPMERLAGEEINWSAFSPPFAAVLNKGLAMKVKDRIQTMGELRAALAAALTASGEKSGGRSGKKNQKDDRDHKNHKDHKNDKKRKKHLFPIIMAFVVVAGIGVMVYMGGSHLSGISMATATPVPELSQVLTQGNYPYQELVSKCTAYDASVELPAESEMLEQTVIRYVHGSHPNSANGGMYLRRSPGSDRRIRLLSSHTPVTVLAVRGSLENSTGYAFVETTDMEYGWVYFQASTDIGLSETNDF